MKSFTIEVLGGAGEIGKDNCLFFNHPDHPFFVDMGGRPGDAALTESGYKNDPLIERAVEICRNQAREGQGYSVFLTHAHYDHWGRLPFFLKRLLEEGLHFPVIYGSQFTIRMVQDEIDNALRYEEEVSSSIKLSEENLNVALFPCVEMPPGGNVCFGNVVVQAIPVEHSSPGSYGFLIKHKDFRNGKMFVHRTLISGDYKHMNAGAYDLAGVDLFISDGTSVTKDRSITESEVGESIGNLIAALPKEKKAFVGVISTNIERMLSVIDASSKASRQTGIFQPSIIRHYSVAVELDVEQKLPRDLSLYSVQDQSQIGTILTTGVWGQGMVSSAAFAKMTEAEKREALRRASGLPKLAAGAKIGQFYDKVLEAHIGGVQISPGDMVILTASMYGFAYEPTLRMGKQLQERGAIVYVDNSAPKHWPFSRALLSAGGHGAYHDVLEVMRAIRPKMVAAYYCDQQRVEIIEKMAISAGADIMRIQNGQTYTFKF